MHPSDHEAEGWLAQLRDGSPPQRAEARRQLAAIFASRGLQNEAIEILVTNAREGFGSADQFQFLARLYRETGNEYLADSAAMEAARLRQGGTGPQSQSGGHAPPPPDGYQRQSRGYQPPPEGFQPPPPGGPTHRRRNRASQPMSGPPAPRLLRFRLARPVRIICWAAVAAVVLGAVAVSVSSPVTSVFFAVAAASLAMALAAPSTPRRTLRVPAGPLGDGSLLLVGILAFLVGGAVLPRTASVSSGGTATSGSVYAGTPTPVASGVAGPAASPATHERSAAQGSAGPSPEPSGAAGPADTTGQQFMIANPPAGSMLRASAGSTQPSRTDSIVGDGTIVVSLAPDRMSGEQAWRRVRAPDDDTGWISVHQLKPAPTDPPPTFSGAAPPNGMSCPSTHAVKGGRASTDELQFHRVGMQYYHRTQPIACFRTIDDARAAGFQPGATFERSSTEPPADSAASPAPVAQATSSGLDPPHGGATDVPATTPGPDAGALLRIVNAGNEGVRLRPTPGGDEILKILADGETLVSLGEDHEDGGRQWRRVRDQLGAEGWIAADFLAAVPATPTTVALATTRPTVTAIATARPPTQVPMPPTTTPQPAPAGQAIAAAPAGPTSTPPAVLAPATKPQAALPATAAPEPTSAVPTPVPPARPPAAAKVKPSGMDCPAAQPIKGNHSSSGEWIYHTPRGQFYSRTRPEDCFATEADARAAGYRPSQR